MAGEHRQRSSFARIMHGLEHYLNIEAFRIWVHCFYILESKHLDQTDIDESSAPVPDREIVPCHVAMPAIQ